MFLTTKVARWEAKGGKKYLELFQHETNGEVSGFSYMGSYAGGNLGKLTSRALAIQALESGMLRAMKTDYPSTKRIEE